MKTQNTRVLQCIANAWLELSGPWTSLLSTVALCVFSCIYSSYVSNIQTWFSSFSAFLSLLVIKVCLLYNPLFLLSLYHLSHMLRDALPALEGSDQSLDTWAVPVVIIKRRMCLNPKPVEWLLLGGTRTNLCIICTVCKMSQTEIVHASFFFFFFLYGGGRTYSLELAL